MDVTISNPCLPVIAENGGLFISQGRGTHIERTIDSFELIFVRQGILSMHEDDQNFTVHAGESLLLRPGHTHGGTADYPADLQFYWMHFFIQDTQNIPEISIPQHATTDRPDYLTMLFRLFLENQDTRPETELTPALLITLILSEISHSGKRSNLSIPQSTIRLAARAKTFIDANSSKPISTSDVADALEVNPDYLGRVFYAVKGKTITQEIHYARIKRAKMMLMETNYTVDKISLACGFENPGYFRRIFRRLEGMSPAKHRQLCCNIHVNTE